MPDFKEEIRKRLAGLSLSPTRENEIVEELSQHLEDQYEQALRSAATEEEAYQAVLLRAERKRSAGSGIEAGRAARSAKSGW